MVLKARDLPQLSIPHKASSIQPSIHRQLLIDKTVTKGIPSLTLTSKEQNLLQVR